MTPRLKRITIPAVALGVIVGLGFFIIPYTKKIKSGEKMWTEALEEFQAAGESLDPSMRFAPRIPDEDNFCATPLLRNITKEDAEGERVRAKLESLKLRYQRHAWPKLEIKSGFRSRRADLKATHRYFLDSSELPLEAEPKDIAADLLRALDQKYAAVFTELQSVSARPAARFIPPVAEVYPPNTPPLFEWGGHPSSVFSVVGLTRLRGILSANTGNSEDTVAAIRIVLKLAEASESDGIDMLSYIFSSTIQNSAAQLVLEGTHSHVFDENQLSLIRGEFSLIDPLLSFRTAFRGELIASLQTHQYLEGPSSIFAANDESSFDRSRFNLNRTTILQEIYRATIGPSKQPFPYTTIHDASEASMRRLENKYSNNERYTSAVHLLPAMSGLAKRILNHHTALAQGMTACALEQFFLENHQYPEKLEQLVPEFLETVPLNPKDGTPMLYKRTSDGYYQLNSIGIDGAIIWSYQP